MPETQLTPEVSWAQRSSTSDAERNYLYVNLKTPDVAKSDADLKITAKNVTFTGSQKKGVTYHVSLDLYGEIDPDHTKVNHNDREVELILRKKELKEEYWPRLLATDKKAHFLKTNFDKWVDEDEQDEAADDDYANNFGGLGDLGGGGGLGNIDFSKLGGLDAAAAAGAEGGEEEGEEEDDNEMPELADNKDQGGKAKIQEVS